MFSFSTCPFWTINPIKRIYQIYQIATFLPNLVNLLNHRAAVCSFFSTFPCGAINQIDQIFLMIISSAFNLLNLLNHREAVCSFSHVPFHTTFQSSMRRVAVEKLMPILKRRRLSSVKGLA